MPLPPTEFLFGLARTNNSTLTLPGNQSVPVKAGLAASLTVSGGVVGANVVSVSYDASTNQTTVVLDSAVVTATPTRAAFASAGTVSVPDSPIDGLEDGQIYYVVKVDAKTIRLSTSATLAAQRPDRSQSG